MTNYVTFPGLYLLTPQRTLTLTTRTSACEGQKTEAKGSIWNRHQQKSWQRVLGWEPPPSSPTNGNAWLTCTVIGWGRSGTNEKLKKKLKYCVQHIRWTRNTTAYTVLDSMSLKQRSFQINKTKVEVTVARAPPPHAGVITGPHFTLTGLPIKGAGWAWTPSPGLPRWGNCHSKQDSSSYPFPILPREVGSAPHFTTAVLNGHHGSFLRTLGLVTLTIVTTLSLSKHILLLCKVGPKCF